MSDFKIIVRGPAAEKLRKLIAQEQYASADEAVADAIDALEANTDPSLDSWLRDVIKPRADALAADPSRARTAADIRARLSGKG